MKIFGYLMLLAMVQLFVFGSQIQRGREDMIPDPLKQGIKDMPMYCKMFGNRLLLLGIIAAICAWRSLRAAAITLGPVILFGAGILLVILLVILDRKKYSR